MIKKRRLPPLFFVTIVTKQNFYVKINKNGSEYTMKRSIFVFVALVLFVSSLVSCGAPEDVEDTGERISGTYVWSVDIGISMESTWIFEEDSNTVTNRRYNGLDYVEESYTYVIGIRDGVKVIKLSAIENSARHEYEFDYGRGYVIIEGERYETPKE